MDPLSLLRDYTVRNEVGSIQQDGNEILFGQDYKFPCSMETAYRSKQGSLYTLEALVFFVKNTHLKHTVYMQQARILKLQIVTFTDRKPLLDYLEGKVSTTDAIELLAPAVGALPSASARDERERLGRSNQEDESAELHALNDVTGLGATKRLWSSVDEWEADLDARYVDSTRLMELIRERERPVRDRESILCCPNKSFLGILSLISKRDEEKKKSEEQQRKEQGRSSEPSMPPPNPANRFAKVEEKRFWRDHLGTDAEELGIDPTQSYIEKKEAAAAASKPSRPSVDLKRPHLHTPQKFISSSPSLSSISKAKPEGMPIIFVPNALQTLLNTYNAKEFLEDGVYVVPEVKAKMIGKKPELIHIHRKMGRSTPVKYEVRDKATALSPKDWDRVVAVFVLGKEWQFKDWPFKDHVDILNRIMGVHVRFEDDSIESVKIVKQWNVKIISLSKHKRHQDRTAVLEFWDKLDAFIRARKINVLF